MTAPPLRLWGREFEGFRRAASAHAAAWSAGTVSATWHGLPELQAAALGPAPPPTDILVVPADWLPAMAAAGRSLRERAGRRRGLAGSGPGTRDRPRRAGHPAERRNE
ncbi:hypothetical protein [Pseudonocardia sp. DLS-67]